MERKSLTPAELRKLIELLNRKGKHESANFFKRRLVREKTNVGN